MAHIDITPCIIVSCFSHLGTHCVIWPLLGQDDQIHTILREFITSSFITLLSRVFVNGAHKVFYSVFLYMCIVNHFSLCITFIYIVFACCMSAQVYAIALAELPTSIIYVKCAGGMTSLTCWPGSPGRCLGGDSEPCMLIRDLDSVGLLWPGSPCHETRPTDMNFRTLHGANYCAFTSASASQNLS